jgi:PAS domain S-box-containing protein
MDRQTHANGSEHTSPAEVERREILDAISKAVLHHSSLQPLIHDILEMILPLGPFDMGRVRLLDAQTDQTMVAGSIGCTLLRDSEETTREPLLQVVREVMKNGKRARVIDDIDAFPNLRTAKREGIRTVVFLPICDADRVLGCIVLGSRSVLTIGSERLRLLESIANQVGIGITKARIFEETSRNLERVRALHEINLAVTSTIDLKSVLDTLLEKIEAALSFPIAATVRMFNQESQSTELIACRNLALEDCRKIVPDGVRGLSGIPLEQKAPLVIPNALKDPRTRFPDFFIKNRLVSYLDLPLIAQGEALGTITIFSREEREFSREDIEFLSAVASHGAMAIHNSQLYHEANTAKDKQEEANLRLSQLLHQITGLYSALAPLDASENPTRMFEDFTERFYRAAGADAVSFRIFDEATSSFVCVGYRGFTREAIATSREPARLGNTLAVYRTGEPLISADTAKDNRLTGKKHLEAGFHSCAFLPFRVNGHVRGVIHLASRTAGFFTEDKKDHLLALSRLVEIVFENRDLFDEVKSARDSLEKANQRLKARTIQQAVLNHFGQLALSSKSIPTLLDEAALEISLVLQVDYCEVLELLPGGDRLVLRAGTGWKKGRLGEAAVTSGSESHAGYALAQNEPLIFDDLSHETRFRGSQLLSEHGVASGVVMTIAGQERPFGTIGAYSAARREFNEEEVHFLVSFAYILASAFNRSQAEQKLIESQRRYENLVESIEGIVWEADAHTFQATFVSHQAERILGFPAAQWLAQANFWLQCLHPQDRRWVIDFCKKATREMRPFELEYRMIAADERVVWIRNIVTVVTESRRPAKLRGVCFDITERRRMEREISEISERERQRIGQDLHDELGQFLTGIACISTSLAQELDGKSMREAATATQIADLTNQAITQTRTLARGLYPVELQANGLLSALQELAVNAETLFGISCQLKCDANVSAANDDVSIHLYRIAQEAIDNAVRHGKSKHIWLRLWDQNGIGIMSVTDDGSGWTVPSREHRGMGLRIMKYRAAMIGGILQVRKGHQRGTIVECSFQRRAGGGGKEDGENGSIAGNGDKKIHSVG